MKEEITYKQNPNNGYDFFQNGKKFTTLPINEDVAFFMADEINNEINDIKEACKLGYIEEVKSVSFVALENYKEEKISIDVFCDNEWDNTLEYEVEFYENMMIDIQIDYILK